MSDVITLSHGAGGRIANKLINSTMVKHFGQHVAVHDQARLSFPDSTLALTTDSFVITPRQFPGGDIGCLAVYGTVNDLCVGGATPMYLTCGFIIEEGFSISELDQICASMQEAANVCQVKIVTGDTKVVPKGNVEGIYINTSGVGAIAPEVSLETDSVSAGDVILVSGDIGRHGACVAGLRNNFGLDFQIDSDCGSLHRVAKALLHHGDVKYMRDATRGGIAAVLNELALSCQREFCLQESDIPIDPTVNSVCEVLGFNPLHLANEGRLVAILSKESSESAISALRTLPESQNASVIGEVCDVLNEVGVVTMRSYLGVKTMLASPAGELLPRIC